MSWSKVAMEYDSQSHIKFITNKKGDMSWSKTAMEYDIQSQIKFITNEKVTYDITWQLNHNLKVLGRFKFIIELCFCDNLSYLS